MFMLPVLEIMTGISFFHRMALCQLDIFLGHLDQPLVVFMKRFDFVFVQIFHVDQAVARAFQRRDDLVQFDVNGERVFILRTLDQENHQEGDDRRAGVDYQLPGVRELKYRPGK